MVKDIANKYQIKHQKSTPYHPQANGQVESTNKNLEAIMTKTVQTTEKTGQTSFRKLYGHTESPIKIVLGLLLIS
jgi:transposase InsO family protein